MKYLFSFLVSSLILASTMTPSAAEAEVRCDALFGNDLADVTVLATHLSPGSNRPWSPFRFRFFQDFFTIQVLGNFAESAEGAVHFPPVVFHSLKPQGVSVNEKNRLVAVLGGDPGVFAFADGLAKKADGWRRIDQARGRTADGHVFLVYEVPLSTSRPNYGFFKVYVTKGRELRELGTIVPHRHEVPGEPMKIQYPNKIYGVHLLSKTRVELASEDGTVITYEIEPPTPASEQGFELRGFRP
jgi:hypothetical protein